MVKDLPVLAGGAFNWVAALTDFVHDAGEVLVRLLIFRTLVYFLAWLKDRHINGRHALAYLPSFRPVLSVKFLISIFLAATARCLSTSVILWGKTFLCLAQQVSDLSLFILAHVPLLCRSEFLYEVFDCFVV